MGWLLTTFEKKWHKWAIGLGIALALVLTALVLVILFFENELHPHHICRLIRKAFTTL